MQENPSKKFFRPARKRSLVQESQGFPPMDNAKLHGQVRPEIPVQQDKTKERAFFGGHAEESDYNGFSDRANDKILKRFLSLAEIPSAPGAPITGAARGW